MTQEELLAKLTGKDDRFACALADRIIAESRETDTWYEYFNAFASMLDHSKSLVRNRALTILAALAQWDDENRFDRILPEFLTHITDAKPITVRQCVKALAEVGAAKPQYIPQILAALEEADFSEYKDSMRPLIQQDVARTVAQLTNSN